MKAKTLFAALTITVLTFVGVSPANSANANSVVQLTPNLVVSPPFMEGNSTMTWTQSLQETENVASAVYKERLYFEIYNYATSAREMGRLGTQGTVETMTDKGIPIRPIGPLQVFNGFLYFAGLDAELSLPFLYRFDGQTTVKVSSYRLPGAKTHFAVLEGQMYVVAFDDEALALGIFKLTDSNSLTKVIDFDAAGIGNFSHYLVPFNGYLYFIATNAEGEAKYWKFDGNIISQAFELNPSGLDVSQVGRIKPTVYKDKLYFSGVAKTGASELKRMLFSLDKAGNIRSHISQLSNDRDFATFRLKVIGNHLFGFVYEPNAQGLSLFRFDGQKFERVEGILQNMDDASPVIVKGNIYLVGPSATTTGQIMVIDGLRAKPLSSTTPALSEIRRNSALLAFKDSLIYAAQDLTATNVTVRQVLKPRLWIASSKSSLSSSQLKQAKAFLKANRTYKKLSCVSTAATSAVAAKRAKAFCKSISQGTSTKVSSTGISGVAADFGVVLELSK